MTDDERCTCHQGRKCANCMMAEGLLDTEPLALVGAEEEEEDD